jgi:hypothetical protein
MLDWRSDPPPRVCDLPILDPIIADSHCPLLDLLATFQVRRRSGLCQGSRMLVGGIVWATALSRRLERRFRQVDKAARVTYYSFCATYLARL